MIVHDDIQLPQYLVTKEGKKDWRSAEVVVKLNDFNRGVFMQYDEEHHEYCRYRNGPGAGDWRAPEEYRDDPLNEKIDVFSFGMNVFAIVTGVDPHPNVRHQKDIQSLIVKNIMPVVDERIANRTLAERRLTDIIKKCFAYHPDNRPDMVEVAHWLRKAYEECLVADQQGRIRP